MKKLNLVTLCVIFSLFASLRSSAANLDSFIIESQYLSNGSVKVNSASQTILVDIALSRSLIANTTTYEDVNWTITVLLKDNYTDNQIVLSTPLTITSADFNGTAFCNKTITAQVPANKYTSYTAQGSTYSTKVFLEYSTNTPVSAGINTGSPTYSSNSYPVLLNYFNQPLSPACCGISVGSPTVWNGQVYNPVYDGYPVPIDNQQFYYSNSQVGTGYGYLDWFKAQTSRPFNNEPGTIINFSDTSPILTQGQTIYSPNNVYRLTLQSDGNLVIYNNTSTNGIWNSKTNNMPAQSFYFQSDLHLVLRNGLLKTSPSVWASSFHTDNGSVTQFAHAGLMAYPYLKLQDDGNLVLHWPNGVQLSSGASATPVIIIVAASSNNVNGDGYFASPFQYSESADGNSGSSLANFFEITN